MKKGWRLGCEFEKVTCVIIQGTCYDGQGRHNGVPRFLWTSSVCYSNRLKHMVPELFDDGEDLLVRPWTIAGGLAFIHLQLPLLSLEDKLPVTNIQVHTIEFVMHLQWEQLIIKWLTMSD